MRATFLIGEIGSWAEFYTGNILLVKKNRQSLFLVLKETWICFYHHYLNISTPPPLTLRAFSKLIPQNQATGRNKRSVFYGESNCHAGCS